MYFQMSCQSLGNLAPKSRKSSHFFIKMSLQHASKVDFIISDLDSQLERMNKEQKEMQNNMEQWKVNIQLRE